MEPHRQKWSLSHRKIKINEMTRIVCLTTVTYLKY